MLQELTTKQLFTFKKVWTGFLKVIEAQAFTKEVEVGIVSQ